MTIGKTKGISSQLEQSLISEATKVTLNGQKKSTATGAIASDDRDVIDTVSVKNGKEVSELMDPARTAAARKAKVEQLTLLVQSGQYKGPDSMVLAQAVADELNVEMLSGAFLQFQDDA